MVPHYKSNIKAFIRRSAQYAQERLTSDSALSSEDTEFVDYRLFIAPIYRFSRKKLFSICNPLVTTPFIAVESQNSMESS